MEFPIADGVEADTLPEALIVPSRLGRPNVSTRGQLSLHPRHCRTLSSMRWAGYLQFSTSTAPATTNHAIMATSSGTSFSINSSGDSASLLWFSR